MIKLPKEVKEVFKKCKAGSITAYAVGSCVREDLLGREADYWEVLCLTNMDKLKELFEEGEDGGQFLRLEEEERTIDITPFEGTIGEYLENQAYTVDAMADNPEKGFLDPFKGRDDLQKKLVRGIGNVREKFKTNPLSMLDGISLAADNDFDIQKGTYEAMVEMAPYLEKVSKEELRHGFCDIILAPFAGKGLRMLAGAELMPAIIGDAAKKLNRRQMEQFSAVCDNIHKTKQNLNRRLGLFYSSLEGKKGEQAMKRLEFDAETEQHLMDSLYLMEKVHFMQNQIELKDFLVAVGPERYEYMNNLAKAQRIIYDSPEARILARKAYMDNIITNKEPIYVEDLEVDRQKLIEEGISEERVDEILIMLTDMVHRKPHENTNIALIKHAKKFSRNKFAARSRKVKWIK